MSSAAPRPGTLVLCQEGLTPIDDGQTLDALPDPVKLGPREQVAVDLRQANERAVATRDWHEVGRAVADAYRTRVKPVLEANPAFRVAYFGTVSITLAMQLGYHLGTWRGADVFLHHHGRKDWTWAGAKRPGGPIEVHTTGLPSECSLGGGDIVMRVWTAHRIHASQTLEMVPHPLAQVDVYLDAPGEDALAYPDDVEAVAAAFRTAIDRLHELYPNAETVHLFAAVPVGLAFLMGTRVSQTIHPPVQTYQFDAKADPKYYAALCLQREPELRTPIRDEERASAARERAVWAEELENLKRFAASLPAEGSWLDHVLTDESAAPYGVTWRGLPSLRALNLCDSSIDLDATEALDGFSYSPDDRRWILADDFLVPLMRRIEGEGDRRRAARLFLLHEGLHSFQALTASTSSEIGRFAKVLEDIDYHADVWSLLYERKLTQTTAPETMKDDPILLRSLMKLAVETMLSFDDRPGPTTEMQIRRVARYLIWSWQYLETERYRPGDDVSHLLASKPMIELAGPEIRARQNRIWYLLDTPRTHSPELALYREHRLHRYPTGPSSPHEEILEGIRTRRGDRLRAGLRGVFELVVPPRA
jgi:hypothetical protein